jgi:hypothetical protein
LGNAFLDVESDGHVFEVQQELSRIFADSRNRGELVKNLVDPHRTDRCALDGAEHHAPEGVSDGLAVAALERFKHELAVFLTDI